MKYMVVLSGGMDSTTLLYQLISLGHEVEAISFNYGQRHSKELACAVFHASELGIVHRVVNLAEPFAELFKGSDSALVSDTPVPHGHYAADNMKKTVVPNRNMMMLAMATAAAISGGCTHVAYAAHAGDHDIYPDCRKDFIEAMQETISKCDWTPPKLLAPFASISKAAICGLGEQLPFSYEDTWSCYEGGEIHCGLCGTCVERREAFELAGVVDETRYAASYEDYQKALAAV